MGRRAALGRAMGAVAAAAALGAPACVSPPTEVLVVIDSDAPPDRVLTLNVTAQPAAGGAGHSRTFIHGGGAPGSVDLPASFAVTPGEGPIDDTVRLTLGAELEPPTTGGATLSFRRTAVFAFTPHATTRVAIFLATPCGLPATGCTRVPAAQCTRSIACEDRGATCGDRGSCVDPQVMPVPVERDASLGRFDVAAASDAVDAPDAASPLDAADAADAVDAADIVARPDVPPREAGPADAGTDAPASDGPVSCGVTLMRCGARCVDLETDPDNCGACGHACSSNRCVLASCDRSGDGADGPMSIAASTMLRPTKTTLNTAASAGDPSLHVADTTGFADGDEVMIFDARGSAAGTYEFARVQGTLASGVLLLASGLASDYAGSDVVEVVRVYHWSSLTLSPGAQAAVSAWDGTSGGVLPIRVAGTAEIDGTLSAQAAGYSGGAAAVPTMPYCLAGMQGESFTGEGTSGAIANGGGGGGGWSPSTTCGSGSCGGAAGGGGGAYGAAGTLGTSGGPTRPGGAGGAVYGAADLSVAFFGSGGGSGASASRVRSGAGGAGGGFVYLAADTVAIGGLGTIDASGADGGLGGTTSAGYGGGGAGGSVLLLAPTVTLGSQGIVAAGGSGARACLTNFGGNGGDGRIAVGCALLNGTDCSTMSSTSLSTPSAAVSAY